MPPRGRHPGRHPRRLPSGRARRRLQAPSSRALFTLVSLAVLLGGEAARAAGAARLTPGFGIVASRNQREILIRIDPEATNVPNQLLGQPLLCRRYVRTVYAPQSRKPLAEEWQANGAAVVLPALDRSGLYAATIIWEDPQNPVKMNDRVELGAVPPEAAAPVIISLRVVSQRAPARDKPVAAPGEVVWLVADILSPTGEAPQCEWTADAGEFVLAGGASAGKSFKGRGPVRWRAPAAADPVPQATVRLKVSTPCRALAAEASLPIKVEEPKGPFARVQWVPARARTPGSRRLGHVFSEASMLTAGPLGSFFLLDAPGRCLVSWGHGGPRFVGLDSAPVAALGTWGDAACLAQGGQLLVCPPEADKPKPAAKLPNAASLVGLCTGAAGDLYAFDNGAPPSIHVLAGPQEQAWQRVPLGPKAAAPWLTLFTLDARTNDAFIFDSRDRVIRQWRPRQAGAYQPMAIAIPVGAAIDRCGPPIAIVPRPGADPAADLPVQLVFKAGTVTEKWTYERRPARWEPTVSKSSRELFDLRFTGQRAARLSDGDLLLGGTAKAEHAAGPLLVQLSPAGEFRRRLPLPELPPRYLAAAPDGRRYVFFAGRSQRLLALGPDGWVVRDLGAVEPLQPLSRLRADRSSSERVYVIGHKARRTSAFRLNSANPTAYLELSYAGLPGDNIPDHEAVDVATSSAFVAVLTRDGKVLLFAMQKTPRYLVAVDTGLRRPAAVALCSGSHDAAGAKQPFLCVLPSGSAATGVHVWQVHTAGGGKPSVTKLGVFPGPKQGTAQLSSPVTIDSAFPDRAGMLYILDRGGAQVRALDLPAIAQRAANGAAPDIPAAPAIDKLPLEGGAGDMAVGPGQVVHIADTEGEALHSYARTR